MGGLGNRSFQGFGLPPDLSRRLEDLARQVSVNQGHVASLKESAVDAPKATAIAQAVAQKVASSVFNITNATGTPAVATGSGTVFAGAHAARPAAGSYPNGTLFWETDRTALYVVLVGQWVYAAGVMATAQATLPGGLGSGDAGFLAYVTDYAHLLRWNGSAWGWGPGDGGSGFVQGFVVDPGTGWFLCSGSQATFLKADGTLGTTGSGSVPSLPNLTSSASLVEFGGTVGTGTAAATGSAYPVVTLRPWFRQ
jgi:hypothetical protein